MQKLIKLSDTHYIVVNDSEIKEGDLVYHSEVSQEYTIVNPLKEGADRYSKGQHVAKGIYNHVPTTNEWYNKERKITHSTEPLEEIEDSEVWEDGKYLGADYAFQEIEYLSLSEVEEALHITPYGCSVEKLAENAYPFCNKEVRKLFVSGFRAAMELNKDKLFTIEQVFNAIGMAIGMWSPTHASFEEGWKEKITQLLLKTEWYIKIVDDKIIIL
jgi:hypothetical protein